MPDLQRSSFKGHIRVVSFDDWAGCKRGYDNKRLGASDKGIWPSRFARLLDANVVKLLSYLRLG